MTEHTYRLSIIIPVRVCGGNQMDRYAQQCLDSIQNAKDVESHWDDFEVIMVDDASDADCLGSLGRNERMNFTLVRNEENLGIGGARNAGLDVARGEYVWYIDGDDMLTEDWCRLFGRMKEEEGNDVQLYFAAFETVSVIDPEKKTAAKKENRMDFPDYACCPVTASGRIVRRDRCVRFPEKVYLEDVLHTFRQLDAIDGRENVKTLNDVFYWRYLNYRPTAYTRSNNFLQANRPSFAQLLTRDPLCRGTLKDKAVSDLFRALADIYDARHELKHANVRAACVERCMRIMENIQTQKWTH